MCEFCEEQKIIEFFDGKITWHIREKGKGYDTYYANSKTGELGIIDISYCPICGRKLCDETETPIEHFLKSEIERSKLRMNAYAECFDGVHVDNDTRKKLLESHIRFCKNALKQCMDA